MTAVDLEHAMREYEVLLAIETHARENLRRVEMQLKDAGQPELVCELRAGLRDIDMGLAGARATWSALSGPQRAIMAILANGSSLRRSPKGGTMYDAHGASGVQERVCRLYSARNLCRRELICLDGSAFDPELGFLITERGRFVLRYGSEAPRPS